MLADSQQHRQLGVRAQGVVGPAKGFVLRLSPKGQGNRAGLVGRRRSHPRRRCSRFDSAPCCA